MTIRAGRCSVNVVLVCAIFAPHLAAAQFDKKDAISPVAPPTLTKPVFDTITSIHDPSGTNAALTLVAEVDGRPITLGDVADEIKTLPANLQHMPYSELFTFARDQLIGQMALAGEAAQQGLPDDPVIHRRIQMATNTILAEEYLRRQASKDVTESALLARYARDLSGKPGPDEVHVRVITKPTRTEALDVIKQLQAGADFADLARRASTDGTAAKGGDLGFVSVTALNRELAVPALVMQPGQFAPDPIFSNAQWFVIKLEERRPGPPVPYVAARDFLETQMIRESTPAIAKAALAKAIVRVFDMGGKEIQEPSPNTANSDAK